MIEFDDRYYVGVSCAILLVSEPFGVEKFEFESEEAREESLVRLTRGIEKCDDMVDRELYFVSNEEITPIMTWDGERWEERDEFTTYVAA